MAKVYLETSFFSECVTIRTGAIDQGRRATSLNWWQTQAHAFELFISDEVIRELSDQDFPDAVRTPALAMVNGLAAVALSPEVIGLADLLVRERVMPGCQKHLANPNKRTHLAVICARLNLAAPQIVTPHLLIVENDNE